MARERRSGGLPPSDTQPDLESSLEKDDTATKNGAPGPPEFQGFDREDDQSYISTELEVPVLDEDELDEDEDDPEVTTQAEAPPIAPSETTLVSAEEDDADAEEAFTIPMQDPADSGQILLFFNLINGEERQSSSSETFSNLNPARPRVPLGKFPVTTREDCAAAVEAAEAAFPKWRDEGIQQRAAVLSKMASQIHRQSRQLAIGIMRETGKLIREAQAEVKAAVQTLRFFASMAHEPWGEIHYDHEFQASVRTLREPVGVVGILSPWNYPLLGAVRKVAPALLWGNSVILKPPEHAPHAGALLALIALHEGVSRGVLNTLHGPDEQIVDDLCDHSGVRALSFGGQRPLGREVAVTCARFDKDVQIEQSVGGTMLVLPEANVERAARDAVRSAFDLAGQDSTSLSRIIIHRAVEGEFRRALMEALHQVRVGPPDDGQSTMGPVISYQVRDQLMRHTDRLHDAGGETLWKPKEAYRNPGGGYYLEPHVMEGLSPKEPEAQQEILGPLVLLFTADDSEELIRLANEMRTVACFIYSDELRESFDTWRRLGAGFVTINRISSELQLHLPMLQRPLQGGGTALRQKNERDFFTRVRTLMSDLP